MDSNIQEVQSLSIDELDSRLIQLLRLNPESLSAYLECLECDVRIPNTSTKAHCYFLSLDGNGRPRVPAFALFVANRIIDFAIPRKEIERAKESDQESGSTAAVTSLGKKAQKLFTKISNSGEGGEVLLSILAEGLLRLPQVFNKMNLKTNPQMHVHGSDGVHAGTNPENGNLAIYWGESKLYCKPGDAVRECFRSLAPFLLGSGGSDSAQERDLQLLSDGLSIESPELMEALKRYLDPGDPMFKKLEFRGLCLVGFDSSSYPDSPNSEKANGLRLAIESSFKSNRDSISKRVNTERIQSFHIEVFCLPFPKVEDFRNSFRREIGILSEPE